MFHKIFNKHFNRAIATRMSNEYQIAYNILDSSIESKSKVHSNWFLFLEIKKWTFCNFIIINDHFVEMRQFEKQLNDYIIVNAFLNRKIHTHFWNICWNLNLRGRIFNCSILVPLILILFLFWYWFICDVHRHFAKIPISQW